MLADDLCQSKQVSSSRPLCWRLAHGTHGLACTASTLLNPRRDRPRPYLLPMRILLALLLTATLATQAAAWQAGSDGLI